MGDPRPGVGLDERGLPDIDWVEIPAGPFIYGEGEPQQTLDLPRFKIARYPVTNSQFQAFIDAGGYQDEHWWQDLKKPEPEKPSWAQANRPRETINWHEAIAYTRWLSVQLGINVRLPTEQQWEKAARGPQALVYPWGNEFLTGFANAVNDLQQTSAVGVYPHGESLYKVADTAGNVWEWCLNDYEHPERIDVKSEVLTDKDGNRLMDSDGSLLETMSGPVLRGGSWYNAQDNLRSAYRGWNTPGNRGSFIGFRLAQD
jgi:formylglycine-generating enzyme required for sulfatase activity